MSGVVIQDDGIQMDVVHLQLLKMQDSGDFTGKQAIVDKFELVNDQYLKFHSPRSGIKLDMSVKPHVYTRLSDGVVGKLDLYAKVRPNGIEMFVNFEDGSMHLFKTFIW